MTAGSEVCRQKLQLRDYQSKIVDYLLYKQVAAIFADPGTGKTSAVLAALNTLLLTFGTKPRVLLIAPLRVCRYVWPAEIEKWEDFAELSCSIMHGTKKQKTAALFGDSVIKLINPEGLSWLFRQKKLPEFDALIIDESTMFKSSNSVRFRLLKTKLDLFPRRYILTGTPTPLGIADLWAQCFLLDKGASLGKFVTRFRSEYFDADQKPYQNWATYTPKKGALDRAARAISHMCLRIDAKDYRSIPPLREDVIKVSLPSEIQTAYDKAYKDLILDLEGRKTLIDSAASKYSMCCQIANGRYYDEDHNVKIAHHAKARAIKALHQELGYRPILVGYQYTHDLSQLQSVFRELKYFGKNEAEDTDLVKRWNRGEIPVLAAQYQTISHGLNLQYGGSDVVWFSPIDNWGSYDQFNRRIYGRDLEVPVTVHLLVASHTVDEIKLARLRSKETGNADLCRRILEQGRKVVNQSLDEQKKSSSQSADFGDRSF